MSEPEKNERQGEKMSDKFVTPDKDAIIIRRKKKPAKPAPKKDDTKKGKP